MFINTIPGLIFSAVKLQVRTFKAGWFFLLLAAFVKNLLLLINSNHRWLYGVLTALVVFGEIFFLSAAFLAMYYRSHHCFSSIKNIFSITWRKIPSILTAFFLLLFLIAVALFLVLMLNRYIVTHWVVFRSLTLLTSTGAALLLTIFLVLVFFAIPYAVLQHKNTVGFHFKKSRQSVGLHYWFKTFFAYLILILLILSMLPHSLHYVWLKKYYLNVVFDMVIFIFGGGFLLSYILALKRIMKT